MNWIQKNYDRAFLIIAALVAVLGAGWIILKASDFKSRFVSDSPEPRKQLGELSAEAVAEADKRLEGFEWSQVKLDGGQIVPLFSSTPFVVMNDRPDDPFPMYQPEPKLRDPIDNIWLVEHDLDYTSVDVREQDPDRDGYTNLDEFLGGTDPNSSLSKPTSETKLYYAERLEDPLTLRLSSYDSGTAGIAFIVRNPDGTEKERRSEYLKVGESTKRFEPGRFKVAEVKTETVDRFGTPTPVAVAYLLDEKDRKQQRIRLEERKEVEHPTYIAKLVYTLTNEDFEKKEGEDFEVRNPAGMTFTVEEIHADNVILSFVPEGGSEVVKKPFKLGPPPQ